MSTLDANKALVRRKYEEGMNKRDFHVVAEVTAEDFVHHVTGASQPRLGRKAHTDMAMEIFEAFPDLQTTLEDVFAEGDRVAVRQIWRGTHRATFRGIPPTNRPVAFATFEIYRVANGLLAEEWVLMDMNGLFRQIGTYPALP
ncbi:MAG: ester cyclase [Polyangiaceae bacterium]|jgi:steroid delta-isomerase-like uncharacterized protein|nr:ester cyclase [Polyangiaceae bacterium]